MKLFLISAIVAVAFCYDIDPSGYGGNDEVAVKKVAAASPRVRPRDYTSNGKPINDPVAMPKYNVPSVGSILGNKFDITNLSQLNNQGQSSVQVGGEQTNVGSNANAINVGQTNQNAGQKPAAGYPAPQYDSRYQPNTYVPQIPSYGGAGAGAADLIKNNLFNVQNLGQTNSQGQENVQVGGAQTNVGSNQNAINVGQTNQAGGQGAGYGAPQYDSRYQPNTYVPQIPSYGGAGAGAADLIKNNLFNVQNLGQTNSQGQENVQVGGAQTNVGSNQNAINVGQTNQAGGQGAGYGAPQYDSRYGQPSYPQQPSYGQYLPQNIFAGNKVDYTGLGQNSNQGQSNTQVGGAQTNVGQNTNTINVGQTNNNGGGQGAGYPAPQYDSKYGQPSYPQPSYGNAASYIPQNVVAGNLMNLQNLGQNNQQGQSSTQVGGAQTNVGSNANAINVGQTNQAGGQGAGYGAPQYDSRYGQPSYPQQPSYGNAASYLPQNVVAGNLFNLQNLGQNNQQGQSSTQVGGAQTNVGSNENAINVGQTNNNAGGQGAGYGAPQYDSKKGGRTEETEIETQEKSLLFSLLGISNPLSPRQTGEGNVQQLNLLSSVRNSDAPGYHAIPIFPHNIGQFLGNHVTAQNLGQNNAQGQSNTQVGGAQTNVGQNTNTINVGQTNNNGGGQGAGYGAPQYDSKYKSSNTKRPSYTTAPPKYTTAPPKYTTAPPTYATEPATYSTAPPTYTTAPPTYSTAPPTYTTAPPTYTQPPTYGAGQGYVPQNVVAGNLMNLQNLGQTNAQGQSNTQVGGAQTNVGSNSNTINVGQTNNNGGKGSPSYDAKIKKVPVPEPEQSYRRRA